MFTVVPLLVAAIFIATIFLTVRNYQAAKRRNIDPFTMQTELTAQLIQSDLLKPAGTGAATLEQRLADVEDLHARGVISAQERATARARILAGD